MTRWVAALLAIGCAGSEDYRIEMASLEQQYRACQAGREDRCIGLGDWLMHEARFDEALVVYRRACATGHAESCARAGAAFDDHALLVLACTKSETWCVAVAMSPDSTPVQRDDALAKVCGTGQRPCIELFERLIRRPIDVAPQARRLCTPPGLDPQTCAELGSLGWSDPAVGTELLRLACSNGHARACWQVARRAADPTDATAAAARACELGHREACDPAAAARLLDELRASCRSSDQRSCETLGRMVVE